MSLTLHGSSLTFGHAARIANAVGIVFKSQSIRVGLDRN